MPRHDDAAAAAFHDVAAGLFLRFRQLFAAFAFVSLSMPMMPFAALFDTLIFFAA